jgi:hypothetical protein
MRLPYFNLMLHMITFSVIVAISLTAEIFSPAGKAIFCLKFHEAYKELNK